MICLWSFLIFFMKTAYNGVFLVFIEAYYYGAISQKFNNFSEEKTNFVQHHLVFVKMKYFHLIFCYLNGSTRGKNLLIKNLKKNEKLYGRSSKSAWITPGSLEQKLSLTSPLPIQATTPQLIIALSSWPSHSSLRLSPKSSTTPI